MLFIPKKSSYYLFKSKALGTVAARIGVTMISRWRKLFSTRLFNAKELNIVNITLPLILTASLVGLLPYSVKFSKTKHTFKIIPKSIYINFLYCALLVFLLFLFSVFHVRYMLSTAEKSQFNDEITTQLNYILEVVIFILFCCTAYISAFIYRSKYVKILNEIISTWRSIPPTAKSITIWEKLCWNRNVMLIGLFTTFVMQMGVNLSRKDQEWKKILVGFTFNMPQIIQLIFHAYYTMLVLAVAGIIESINSHCHNLTENYYATYPYIDVKPTIKRMTLRQMELVYMKAFGIKTDINRAFQGTILASLLQSFHAVVSEAHILYHGLLVDKNITTHELINCSTWMFFQLIKIYSLSYSGSALKLQALKAGQILHCIPTERYDLHGFMEVQHFSSLLKHLSLEINIFGFFPLDATLIFNMFASATMYLIILVQFDNSD